MWTLERGVVNNLADLRAKNLTRLGRRGEGEGGKSRNSTALQNPREQKREALVTSAGDRAGDTKVNVETQRSPCLYSDLRVLAGQADTSPHLPHPTVGRLLSGRIDQTRAKTSRDSQLGSSGKQVGQVI